MAISATVTCVYTVNCYGQQTPTQVAAAMSASQVPIPPDFYFLTGCVLGSDTTSTTSTSASRTVVFGVSETPINGFHFLTWFPDDPISPFRGLLTKPIQAAVIAPVVESLPVFSL